MATSSPPQISNIATRFIAPAALLLLPVSACKVNATASASVDAGGVAGDVSASTDINVKVYRDGDELVHEDGEINFDTDEATLVGEKTDATLEAYAEVLQEYPDVHVRIEGHTDSRGSDAHNRKLSDARAHAVKAWLVDAGTDKGRLEARGLGEDSPRVEESVDCKNVPTSDAPTWCEDQVWSHNRRSQFHVTSGIETLPKSGDLLSASSKETDVGPGIATGPYIYLSPGFARVPVADRDETDARRVSYRWGLGAGYLWRRQKFMAALGLGFAHLPVAIDKGSDRCSEFISCRKANEFVLDAELRLGGGSERVVGYGLLGPGLVIGRSRRIDAMTDVDFTTGGFNLDLGAGVWGHVWRGLFLGGEVAMNIGVYASDARAFHDSARVTGLDLRFLMGWNFGWAG
ncbi:MAG: OmpA family protein [Nannocystaceae bacterium]|nr:OmpA family protein [Nannocystaceae bacterium]